MLEKKSTIAAITVKASGHIEVQREDVIVEDGIPISTPAYHRHVLCPGDSLEGEDSVVVQVAQAVWTPKNVQVWTDDFIVQQQNARDEKQATLDDIASKTAVIEKQLLELKAAEKRLQERRSEVEQLRANLQADFERLAAKFND